MKVQREHKEAYEDLHGYYLKIHFGLLLPEKTQISGSLGLLKLGKYAI
jgi:hypothetical protein